MQRTPKFLSPPETASSKGSRRDRSSAGGTKKPRTVHIDVYCTGSELDSGATSQDNSPTVEKVVDAKTLFESDSVRLDSRQAAASEMPRRMAPPPPPVVHRLASPIPEIVSPPREPPSCDITEAKQMLFDRYLGDQTQRFNAMRNRLRMRRDISDDAISSNYPNSSYSTFRDMTCSSISSVFAGDESSMKETTDADSFLPSRSSLYPSDSFEYENSDDRVRIKLMSQNWAGGNGGAAKLQTKLKSLSESEDEDDAMQEFVFSDFNRMKNASSRSLDVSGAESCSTVKLNEQPVVVPTPPSSKALPPNDSGNSTLKSFASDLYSRDYISKARQFGALIKVKKPGHHIGPVRNPECQCEHCRHWMAEREQIRNRAMSTGDVPQSRLERWKKGQNAE